MEYPREMTANERAVMDRLLGEPFPGREILMTQARNCKVSTLDDEGSVEFHVLAECRAPILLCRVPVEATVSDVDGVAIHLLLHIQDGVIKMLEIFREDGRSLVGEIKSELMVVSVASG